MYLEVIKLRAKRKELKDLVSKAIGEKTVTDFAKKADLNRSYLSSLKNGSEPYEPNPDILKKIAKISYEVNYIDLMIAAGYINESDIRQKLQSMNNNNSVNDLITLYKTKVEGENGNELVKSYNFNKKEFWKDSECKVDELVAFPEKYVMKDSFAVKMANNRLKDWGIIKDDYILIRPTNDEPENGSTILVIIRKGGDYNRTIKRYYIINKDKVRLEPDVENYGEIDKSEVEIKGVVVYMGRKY